MRSPPQSDNWAPSLPPEDREKYRAAWNDFRACRDCKHWYCDDDDDCGVCMHDKYHRKPVSFQCPEDYTCEDFETK